MNKKHGNIGNKHNEKTPGDVASAYIHARCKPSDKAAWAASAKAQGMKMTEWILKTLNNAVK
jgi:hypothetical protein